MSGDIQPRRRKGKGKKKDDVDDDVIETKGKAGHSVFTKNNKGNSSVDNEGSSSGSGVVAKAIFLLLLVSLSVVVALILVELRGKQKAAMQESASVVPGVDEEPVPPPPPPPPPAMTPPQDEVPAPPDASAPVLQETEDEPEPIEATPPLDEYIKVVEEVVVVAPPAPQEVKEDVPVAASEPEEEEEEEDVPVAASEPEEEEEEEEAGEESVSVESQVEEVDEPAAVVMEEVVVAPADEGLKEQEESEASVVEEVIEVVEVKVIEPVEEVVEIVEEVVEAVKEAEVEVPQTPTEEDTEQVVQTAPGEDSEEAVEEDVITKEAIEVDAPVSVAEEEAIPKEEPVVVKVVEPLEAPASTQEEEQAVPIEETDSIIEASREEQAVEEEEEEEDDEETDKVPIVVEEGEGGDMEEEEEEDWSQYGKEGNKGALNEAYLQVESLAEDILALDPHNNMVGKLAPHLAGVLQAMEEGQTEGLLNTLSHIQVILQDVKQRIEENEELAEEPQGETAEEKQQPPPGVEETSSNSIIDDKLKEELDEADKLLSENPGRALHIFGALLHHNPKSARAMYGRAKSLDQLAEIEKSNSRLEQAIITYRTVLDLADEEPSLVPLPLLQAAAERCIDRMKFRGFFGKALRVQQRLLQRFPDDVSLRNKMGVTYLLMNQGTAAKEVFEAVLKQWPDDGFAQVHYGFVLKTTYNNMTGGAYYMRKGIDTNAEGTQDERFFFHLGDALQRQGKIEEAYKIYDDAVERGMFLNRYQRSLYNVDRLTSRPLWEPEQTTYQDIFRKLEENWEVIRNEGVALLGLPVQDGFRPEAENLRDTGDWKQYELFTKGRKIHANCVKAPRTCSLIENFPAAAGCKRGQVKFSVMQPQTHVHAHTGPTNCRLRAHLGLVVPDGLQLRVGQKTTTWQEGKFLIFDDSWEHEVWHEGGSYRLVLIVDVWHPELTENERNTLSPI